MIRAIDDTSWSEVGHHDFDTTDELDVTLTRTLRSDETHRPRLRGIDPEEAEKLLSSAREAGVHLEVHVCIENRLVRIDSDGVVAVRDER